MYIVHEYIYKYTYSYTLEHFYHTDRNAGIKMLLIRRVEPFIAV